MPDQPKTEPTGAARDVRGRDKPAKDKQRKDLGVREPEGESKEQLESIQERNRELIDDDAEPGPEGERETGVGQSVKSVPSQTGDYASD